MIVEKFDEKSLTALPVGKTLDGIATETIGNSDSHADCLVARLFNRRKEVIEGSADREGGGMVTTVVLDSAVNIGSHIRDCDIGRTADNHLSCNRVHLYGAVAQLRQTAVASHTHHLHLS